MNLSEIGDSLQSLLYVHVPWPVLLVMMGVGVYGILRYIAWSRKLAERLAKRRGVSSQNGRIVVYKTLVQAMPFMLFGTMLVALVPEAAAWRPVLALMVIPMIAAVAYLILFHSSG